MNDESKRRLAASLEKPLDAKSDRQLADALEKDPQAKAWVAGLKTVDSALRRWPSPARSANEWEDFAARLEKRLGESPWSADSSRSDSFDPLAPPVLEGDDGEAQRVEQSSMGSPDKNDDDDLEALAALTRSSTAPTSLAPPPKAVSAGPALHDDAMDESSGIVDMKQLAELALKQPAPPPTGALAPTPADTTGRSDAAVMAGEKPTAREGAAVPPASAAAEAKAAKKAAPVDAAPAKAAEPEKKGGVSWVLWVTPLIAAAAGGAFFFMKSNAEHAANTASTDTVEQREIAPATPSAAAPAVAPAQPAAPPPTPPTTVAMNGPEEQGAAAPANAAPAGESAPAPTQAAPQQPEANAAPTVGAAPGASANAGAVARNEAPAADDSNTDRHAAARSGTASARSTTVATADTTAAEGSRRGGESDGDQGSANTRSGSRGSGAAATGAPAATPPPATTTTVAAAAPARTPTPAAAAPAGGSTGGARSMDELMATAVGGSHGSGSTTAAANLGSGGGGSAAAAPAGDALPDRPSRAQVTATMTPLSPAVRACTQGQTGVATVAMVIRSDGTVQSASVSGPFSGDANNCITGVVRRAHFPAFTRPMVPIVYPFSIQPPRPGAQ